MPINADDEIQFEPSRMLFTPDVILSLDAGSSAQKNSVAETPHMTMGDGYPSISSKSRMYWVETTYVTEK